MSFVEDALKFHAEHNGMLAVASKVPLNNREDLALAYTPGVAEPCKAIKENKELSFEYTCRGNTVAIVSDGTRVLGLGDIGPRRHARAGAWRYRPGSGNACYGRQGRAV